MSVYMTSYVEMESLYIANLVNWDAIMNPNSQNKRHIYWKEKKDDFSSNRYHCLSSS